MSMEIDRDDTDTTEEDNVKDEQIISDISSSLDSPSPSALRLDRIPSQTLYKCSFLEAKSFLSKCEGSANDSIWNHLSELITKILEERPVNIIDYLEQYSARVKRERFEIANNHIQKVFVPTSDLDYAKRNIELIKAAEMPPTSEITEEVNEEESEVDGATTSNKKMGFLQFMDNFRQAGVGLSKDESYLINLSLIKLQKTKPAVQKFKFWGKIFGLKKDYLLAECDLTKEEIERREEEEQERIAKEKELEEKLEEEQKQREEEEQKKREEEEQKQKEEEEKLQNEQMKQTPSEDKSDENKERASEDKEKEIPVVPLRDQYKRPKTPQIIEEIKPEIESEPLGEGINKKVYFVCNEPGDDWIELPTVTPKQIQIARKIKRYFTGDLEAEINTYPIFPGNEKNYLRAQIARISSSTHISPLGYYTFSDDLEEEEEEEDIAEDEEEGKKISFVSNSQYEPSSIEELTDPSMSFWVHHAFHLLKQGRATFWKPKPIKDEEEEEAEEEQEEEEDEEAEGGEVAEEAQPLLTPLSGDTCLETRAMWTVQKTSIYAKENAVAFVASNLWPGAYAFASGRSYGNIYIGWGHKYLARGYSPVALPHPEEEYEIGPEVMEMTDPTPEMEEEWREKQRKKEEKAETEGEEGEEEEDEEEGDEDEDDED
ncbi:hypothetical protein LSTR_LSTR002008 [Laodelphax striatellus]|uniref:Radial spokehead-like protein n=1 Tax=Laodelphax striatellus TaxID=195883 RepID=A0A482XH99_LAOST|nr:hypothetical protein LSTR_LSTR002008 [Laodelphax striatellus]